MSRINERFARDSTFLCHIAITRARAYTHTYTHMRNAESVTQDLLSKISCSNNRNTNLLMYM